MENDPEVSVLESRDWFVARLVALTATFGRTAPDGSVIVPSRVAVVSWAKHEHAHAKAKNIDRDNLKRDIMLLIIALYLSDYNGVKSE
jgi:hypothetical protein